MTDTIDVLTSPTLKHLRERVVERRLHGVSGRDTPTQARQPDSRCRLRRGPGRGAHRAPSCLAGPSGRRRSAGDRRRLAASSRRAAHNQRVGFAAADVCRLPFRDGVFDSTFCVAVLQHVGDVDSAVASSPASRRPAAGSSWWSPTTARATRKLDAGRASSRSRAALEFFAAHRRGSRRRDRSGPRPEAAARSLRRHGIEPLDVRLFPVSQVHWDCHPTRYGPAGGGVSRALALGAVRHRSCARPHVFRGPRRRTKPRRARRVVVRRDSEHHAVCDRWPEED